jgi:hypothetical protein
VTLSDDEIGAMKSARREVEEFRSRRKWVWCWIAGELAVLWFLDQHFSQVGGSVGWALLAILAVKTFRDWRRFKWLSLRFPVNMQALQRWRDQGVDVRTVLKQRGR